MIDREESTDRKEPVDRKQAPLDRRAFLKKCALAGPVLLGIVRIEDSEASPEYGADYKAGEHDYGMGIDVGKCIGCGRCAHACKNENDVPREPFFFRTWIERYVIPEDGEALVDSPNGGIDGFPPVSGEGGGAPDVLRSQAVQPLRQCSLRTGLPRGRDFYHEGRRGAGG